VRVRDMVTDDFDASADCSKILLEACSSITHRHTDMQVHTVGLSYC